MAAIGRILLMPKGDYSSSVTYNSLDWVRYGGAAWVCTTDNTTNVPPSTLTPEWQILAEDGSVGGWTSLQNKPFETIGSGLDVDSNNELNVDVAVTVTDGDMKPVTSDAVYDKFADGLNSLGDVNITLPADGQILEYDSASGKWKNGDNVSSMARYGGAKTFAELTSALLIAANVDKFYLCTDGGTIQNADAANWLLPVGSEIPPDSHIAVIEDPYDPGSYVFDDFGGYIDISGKADKVDVADKTDLASIRATGSTNATGAAIPRHTYFYLNNVLVKAKTDIAVGATFTNGTNYETVTAGALNEVIGALPKFYYFAVTIGSTKSIPVIGDTTFALFLMGANSAASDIYLINCNASGSITTIKTGNTTGSDIALTTSNNLLNIKNNSNSASLRSLAIVYRGDITV